MVNTTMSRHLSPNFAPTVKENAGSTNINSMTLVWLSVGRVLRSSQKRPLNGCRKSLMQITWEMFKIPKILLMPVNKIFPSKYRCSQNQQRSNALCGVGQEIRKLREEINSRPLSEAILSFCRFLQTARQFDNCFVKWLSTEYYENKTDDLVETETCN